MHMKFCYKAKLCTTKDDGGDFRYLKVNALSAIFGQHYTNALIIQQVTTKLLSGT